MATKSTHSTGDRDVPEPDTGMLACIFTVIYFVFGGTFLGIVFFMVGAQLNGPVSLVMVVLSGFWIGGMFLRRSNVSSLLAVALALAVFLLAEFAVRGLAAMATNGVYGYDRSGMGSLWVENYLLFGILWCILGVPYRGFKYKIDLNGEGISRDTVVASLAVMASILTGVFILMLHLDEGPFSQVDIKALIVGDIFTVFLIVPIYRWIAIACWQRGIWRSLSPRPFLVRWRKAAIEIDAASMEYFKELYSRERQRKLISDSVNDVGITPRQKPASQNPSASRSFSLRMEPKEAKQANEPSMAESAELISTQGHNRPFNKRKGSQKRRKKVPRR